ncbi:MAG: universal stress protein [Deltaproteobacteria bacterium]|nr:MAG: universal stress protein [Deltaproteobacteria bacterium]
MPDLAREKEGRMFKNLLIAMDLSHASVCLLRCVGPLRTAGAESATLVHVMNVRSVGGLYISLKHLVEPLLEMKEKQLEEAGFRTHLEIPLGDPAYEINRVAKERDASLIVAGTHGESLTKEILLGSVAHRLLQIAEKPVLLIPITALEGEHWERKCDALCRDLFRHPLFATDFSEPAERAFHYLEHIAAHTHPPEATLFHAQDPGRILPHLAHRIDEFNRIDRERLDALEVRLREWGARTVYKEVEFGRPGPLIVEKIRKGSCSILVIGGQGRGYMAEAFLGRVANHVVHRSTIPVLVVPGHP